MPCSGTQYVTTVVLNIGSPDRLALVMAVLMDRSPAGLVAACSCCPTIRGYRHVAAGMLDPRLGGRTTCWSWPIGRQGSLGPRTGSADPGRYQHNGSGLHRAAAVRRSTDDPRYLYEAAALDGAGEWRTFWRVTLPLLRPVLALVLVLSVVGSFQVFDLVQVATGGIGGQPGGPANASLVIYVYIFRQAFSFHHAGYAAAMAVVLAALLAVVTFLIMRGLRGSRSDLA